MARFKLEVAAQVAEILGVEKHLVVVEPANSKFDADLAIPLFRFGTSEMNPPQLAENLAAELAHGSIERTEAVSGFLNIWLNTQAIADGLFTDLEQSTPYGNNYLHANQEVVVEFTDPNPFKELHIGHAYSNTVGESLARIMEAAGATAHRVTYGGDVGMHVAKALWGILELERQLSIDFLGINEHGRATFLGRAYAHGAKAFENSEESKAEIVEINKKVYEQSDELLNSIYNQGREWSFEYFKQMYKRLNVHFEKHYVESEATPKGMEVVREGQEKGVFEESDGAVIFRGEDHGLHTRVFITKEGLPTYEAKDLGLMYLKDADYHYDRSIILTATEQSEYFKVMLKAAELLQPELANKTVHLFHGMVRLTSGKMSSRTGDVVTAKDLLDSVESAVKDANPETPSVVENALGAFKYAMLKAVLGGDIIYDVEESLDIQGNSGPYIQYATVRISSILEKVGDSSADYSEYDWQSERGLLIQLAKYPEVVATAVEQYEPHHICNFTYELARELNRYYENVSVKDAPENEKAARISLLRATHHVFNHSLGLLNVPVPERM